MGRTKKVRSAGRLGVRYGRKIRQRLVAVEKGSKKKHICPTCRKESLKKERVGIWKCDKCGLKMAGKAFKPS